MNASLAARLLPLAAAGCSLLYPPGDYFDPDGKLTTLTLLGGTVDGMADTRDALFVAVGSDLQRVGKNLDGASPVASLGGGRLQHIASDGDQQVAWCDSEGKVFVWSEALRAASRLGDIEGCESVAVRASSVVVSVKADQGRDFLRFEQGKLTQTIEHVPVPGPQDTALVALSSSGAFFVASQNGVGRICQQDCSSPGCLLSTRTNGDVIQRAFVEETAPPAAGFALLLSSPRTTNLHTFDGAASTACLDPKSQERRGPVPVQIVSVLGGNAVLHQGKVYALLEGRLLVAPRDRLSASPQPSVSPVDPAFFQLVQGDLGANLRELIVDDRYAFFVDGQKLQRLRLP